MAEKEAVEKPWAMALGVERKRHTEELLWSYSHQNLEANYMRRARSGIEMGE